MFSSKVRSLLNMMSLRSYEPSLDYIVEERSYEANDDMAIDRLISDEYANISTDDLLQALGIEDETTAALYKNDQITATDGFSSMHNEVEMSTKMALQSANNNDGNEAALKSDHRIEDTTSERAIVHEECELTFNNKFSPLVNKRHLALEDDASSINMNCSLYTSGSVASSTEDLHDVTPLQLSSTPSAYHQGPAIPMMFGVDFDSDEGRKLFTRAVADKYMNVYYAYTKSLVKSTEFNELTMILDVLGTECQDKKFDTLLDFLLAILHQLEVCVTHIHQFSSIKQFRLQVKSSCVGKHSTMFCYFKNSVYGYLLVVGYLKERDSVLLLHQNKLVWVSLLQLWTTLQGKKNTDVVYTGGYVSLRTYEDRVFKTALSFTVSKPFTLTLDSDVLRQYELDDIIAFFGEWNSWLALPCLADGQNIVKKACTCLLGLVKNYATAYQYKESCSHHSSHTDEVSRWIYNTQVYRQVKELTDSETTNTSLFCHQIVDLFQHARAKEKQKFRKMLKKSRKITFSNLEFINLDEIIASLILFYPSNKAQLPQDSNAFVLAHSTSSDLTSLSQCSVDAFKHMFLLVSQSVNWFSMLEAKRQSLLEMEKSDES